VKKLRGSPNEYRLRVGNYRVLFELVGRCIVVYISIKTVCDYVHSW